MPKQSPCLLLWLALPAVLFAPDLPTVRQFDGQHVVTLRFEPPEQIETSIPVKVGAPLRVEDVRAAVKQLYATGRYEDIEVEGEPVSGGVAIVVHTVARWFIGSIDVAGNIKLPPNREQLADASALQLGHEFSPDQIPEATSGIQDLLKRNGFYEAKVDPVITRDASHQQVHIRFDVQPGKRAKFNEPVIAGQPVLSSHSVISATKWRRFLRGWGPVTADSVQKGLQRVRNKYEKDDRLMANVKLQGMDFDPETYRVTPTIQVVGGPKVKVRASGAKVSKKKLKTYVPIYDEGQVYRDLLVTGARNLRDYLQMEGYFNATVDFQEQKTSPDREEITYTIDPGKRQKLESVQLEGNHYFDTATLQERMFLQPAGLIRWRHGRYSQVFVTHDEKAIKDLYAANGFRDAKVDINAMDNYRGHPGEIGVVARIDEGPQYVVSDLSVSGVQQLDIKSVTSQLSSSAGEPFSDTNIAIDRNLILNLYNSSGFPDAAFSSTVKPGPGAHQYALHYTIQEGPRRYVRDVLIAGAEHTRRRLIDPALHVQAGQPLSLSAMTDTQRNIYDLGVFDQVKMAVQNPGGDTDRKYVLYQLDEGHRYYLAAGFGAEFGRIGGSQTSLSSPGGQTGFSPRGNFEISRFNLWGLGHSLNFKSSVSTLEQVATLSYSAPRYRNVEGRDILFSALYDDRKDVRTFASKREEGSAQLSQKLSKASTILWRYTFRHDSISDLKIQPLLIPLLSQPSRIGMISTNYVFDRRDDPVNAHRGFYDTVDLGVSEHVLGSNRNFGRFLGTEAWYHPFGPFKQLVVAQRLQFGWLAPFGLKGIAADEAIPLPDRFFGGGSTSHRGFPDNQAGPRDPQTGFPLGGNALLVNNLEFRFPLIGDNISGVLFHDMGNVYSSPGSISFRFHQRNLTDFNYMVHAVGFGIRYHTPVGPIRVDLAYSINPPQFYGLKGDIQQLLFGNPPRVQTGVSHFQFFFSIGQAF